MNETTWLFCRGRAAAWRSRFDVLGEPPDMWEVSCAAGKGCGLSYHSDGSTPRTSPDLQNCGDLKTRIRSANERDVPIFVFLTAEQGIIVREQPAGTPA